MKCSLLVALLCLCVTLAFTSTGEANRGGGLIKNFPVFGTNTVVVGKERTYCSPFAKTKYKLLINNDKIRITRLYKEYKDVFTGIIKKGKIYSNDPNEKGSKLSLGKYYKLEKNNFGVLNSENGDYEWFSECKE